MFFGKRPLRLLVVVDPIQRKRPEPPRAKKKREVQKIQVSAGKKHFFIFIFNKLIDIIKKINCFNENLSKRIPLVPL